MQRVTIPRREPPARRLRSRQATFSIGVVDPVLGIAGAATASRYVAVASLVLHAQAEAGVILTQSIADRGHGLFGLPMLAQGHDPQTVLDAVTAGDERLAIRQVAVIDWFGRTAHYSGAQCTPVVATCEQAGVVALGNMLAHPEVPDQMVAAFWRVYGHPESDVVPDPVGTSNPLMSVNHAARTRKRANRMAEALIAALLAGEYAGGDKRGKQASGVLVVAPGTGYSGRDDRAVDLRVDDHSDPVEELDRIFRVFIDNQQREFAE